MEATDGLYSTSGPIFSLTQVKSNTITLHAGCDSLNRLTVTAACSLSSLWCVQVQSFDQSGVTGTFFKGEGGRLHVRRITVRTVEKEIKVGTNQQVDSFHVL